MSNYTVVVTYKGCAEPYIAHVNFTRPPHFQGANHVPGSN